jgi:hypothetical protein
MTLRFSAQSVHSFMVLHHLPHLELWPDGYFSQRLFSYPTRVAPPVTGTSEGEISEQTLVLAKLVDGSQSLGQVSLR